VRDDQELTLRVPSDGGSRSVRAVLDRLDEHGLNADEFSVHTPDLDDVFLALTGHADTGTGTLNPTEDPTDNATTEAIAR